MKIFVRTQDRSKILEVDCISYEEKKKTTRTVHSESVTAETVESRHRLVCCNRTLGEYESKERCLGILDLIQHAISKQNSNTTLVYEMPEV